MHSGGQGANGGILLVADDPETVPALGEGIRLAPVAVAAKRGLIDSSASTAGRPTKTAKTSMMASLATRAPISAIQSLGQKRLGQNSVSWTRFDPWQKFRHACGPAAADP
jgi:hypothetical protein